MNVSQVEAIQDTILRALEFHLQANHPDAQYLFPKLLQKMADLRRLSMPHWYMPGISAALAGILAAVILINPFGAALAVWTFVAISLIVEAILEIIIIAL